MEEEKIYRQKVFKIGAVSIGICLLIAYWYATQGMAEECGYSKILGNFLSIGDIKIYPPYKYYFWQQDAELQKAIPQIIGSYAVFPYIGFVIGAGFTYLCAKNLKKETSHGSAAFATAKEIDEAGLGKYEDKKSKKIKKSGVVVGVNPYTKHLMLHDGVEHILLVAPTRSGKGVNTIIPTGLVWQHSIFFFDVKEELWQATAGYRQKVLGQKVMKFAPLIGDGSSARWNPLAEINFRTAEEISDVAMIVGIMVKPDGEKAGGGGDSAFWDNSAAALITGVIMHLLYKHHQENLRLPCPTDIMSFLSSPDMDLNELFTYMKNYPHISPEEFLEMPDEKGIPRKNPLKEIYGEYVQNLRPFARFFKDKTIKNLEDVRRKTLELMQKEEIDWEADEDEAIPFHILLTHPKVAECAANMLNGAEQTRASIMQTAQTALALYQNPVVQKNTEVSDFCIKDLLSPKDTVSLYLCMHSNEVQTLKPLSRLLINTMLHKLVRDIKFDTSGGAKMKQRLLLMLDEFPQLGNLKSMELALAVCAGYGIKVCIVAQDVNQLNKEYTKDNSIASNCHVHIYFTPNLDSGAATAESISKNLGKKTISTVSHSDGGGLGKGSNSESFTGRELMTADEVSHMSSERELVFVAGHRPIYGKKLRYYLQPFFTERLKKYQEIYVKEHGYEEGCKKFTKNGKHNCEECLKNYKKPNGLPEMICPTYPLYSDSVTKVLSYEDLFAVNAGEKFEREEKARAVQIEKEFEARKNAAENSKEVDLSKENKNEEKKSDEKIESVGESREVAEVVGEKQFENAEDAGADGKNLGEEIGESTPEKSESEIMEEKLAAKIISDFYFGKEKLKKSLFGESLANLREYDESWEKFINGD
ncbi:MAG: type IV secretory system conjugative DNA transfer family protein [Selenomonadaceae bacterium]|nr:type IV secretory system conjugative DNA transfer family protein [Selenomonadaceae bacterium]